MKRFVPAPHRNRWIAPWRTRSRWLLGLSLLVTLALSVISLRAFPALPLQGDSVSYYLQARHLAGIGPSAGLFYPPGYSLLLAALSGNPLVSFGTGLILLQHLLRLLPFIFLAMLASRERHSLLPGLASLVFAAAPETYVFAHYVMSESLALGLSGLCACAFLVLMVRPAVAPAGLAGFLTGLLTLVRPAGAVFLLAVALAPRAKGKGTSRSLLALAVLAGWGAVLMPMMARNAMVSGSFTLTNSLGRHLFNRVVADGRGLRPGDPDLAALNRIRGVGADTPATYWWNCFPPMLAAGLSESQADRELLLISLRAVLRRPVRYLAGTLRGGADLAFWGRTPGAGASSYRRLEYELAVPLDAGAAASLMHRRIPQARTLSDMASELAPIFSRGPEGRLLQEWVRWWRSGVAVLRPLLLLFLGAGVAFAFSQGGRLMLLPVVVALSGLLVHAAFEMPVPRYGLVYQPFVFLLLCAGPAGVKIVFCLLTRNR